VFNSLQNNTLLYFLERVWFIGGNLNKSMAYKDLNAWDKIVLLFVLFILVLSVVLLFPTIGIIAIPFVLFIAYLGLFG
jgi:fatty acid desaturase